MDLANLLDPVSALLVVGGTALATALRSGARDCALTFRSLIRLFNRRFDADSVKAELARQLREIEMDGLLRANPHLFGDREFDDATAAMIEARSVDALLVRHEYHRTNRAQRAKRASSTLAQASELAPVFGLAGTLVSLSQLPAGGLAQSAFAGTISMAVLTTLYGLLLGNLMLAPLSRLLDRAHAREEAERQKLFDWLADKIRQAGPRVARAEPAVAA
ncbi:MAG: MotA/TolQ/ExbB proton channel family protein [Novosphingobium sp.]